MTYTTFFIAILILAAGFIAYFGDLLGRKMGKKRLTMLKLRPRYTAIIFTTVTGMLISALVIAAMLSVNSNLRELLTKGQEILTRNESLELDNTKLEKLNKNLVNQSSKLQSEVKNKQKEALEAQKAYNKALAAQKTAEADVKRLADEIKERKIELEALRKKNEATEKELKQKAVQLDRVQNEFIQAQKNLDRAINELDKATVNLSVAEAKLTTAESRLKDTEAKLDDAEKTLAKQQEQIQRQKGEIEATRNMFLESFKQASALRGQDLIITQSEEIARMVISPMRAESGIMTLLRTASDKALKLGAQKGENGRAVTVIFIDRKTGEWTLDEKLCIQMAISTISSSMNDVLVQVVAFSNTLMGEQVQVELKMFKNNLVFAKGEKIASVKIDGRLSEGRILMKIINFLQGAVSISAQRAGVVPKSGIDTRAESQSNPEQQLEALLEVVNQIKSNRSFVNVEVLAKENIYSAGPVNMDNLQFVITK
ncbi:MAG: DUF3084 domain-containing protein [Armatimonadota bacterium]